MSIDTLSLPSNYKIFWYLEKNPQIIDLLKERKITEIASNVFAYAKITPHQMKEIVTFIIKENFTNYDDHLIHLYAENLYHQLKEYGSQYHYKYTQREERPLLHSKL